MRPGFPKSSDLIVGSAWPPDVGRGFAAPKERLIIWGYAPRLALPSDNGEGIVEF